MSSGPFDFELGHSGVVTQRLRGQGVTTFAAACSLVERLPYGRVSDSPSPTSVLDQQRGTCSSKHALLAQLAHESRRFDIHLTLGYLELTESNSPGIAALLQRHSLPAIPEAHCYLRFGTQRLDFTGLNEGSVPLVDSVVSEERIAIDGLREEKRRRHEQYLRRWSAARRLDPSLVWSVREAWIEALAYRLSTRDAQ